VVATVLTLGFNVETIESESVKYNVWDVGGSGNIRGLWSHYYENVQGLIFVVDSSEPERLEEATNEINKLLVEEALKDTVLLVYANKFDIGVLTLGELSDKLGLPALQDRVW
jgi:small GTP-binding protein